MNIGLPPPLLVFRSHSGDEDYESAVDAREIVGIVPLAGERTVTLADGETYTIPCETRIIIRGCEKRSFVSIEPAKDLIVRWIDVMRAHDARARDAAR